MFVYFCRWVGYSCGDIFDHSIICSFCIIDLYLQKGIGSFKIFRMPWLIMIKNSKKGADTILQASFFFFALLYSIWNWIEGFIELTFGFFFFLWGVGGGGVGVVISSVYFFIWETFLTFLPTVWFTYI